MIPFNRPVHLGTELNAMAEAIIANGHVAGGGPFGARCERTLEAMLGCRVLLVTSGTHALEMAAVLSGVGPGDEVIVPSFTFVSTANAFVLRGARPVFADCDENGNLSPEEVEWAVGPRTRAVVNVHYAGATADPDALADAARGVQIIDDAAQSLGSRWKGRPLGTFGRCAAISFHETKNVGCGEGGALVINEPSLVERAEYLRDKGTNRRKFRDGLVDKYTWVDLGSSWVLSDLNAAYLSTQLVDFERIQARRRAIVERYQRELAADIERAGFRTLRHGPQLTPNHHMFALVTRTEALRRTFIDWMKGKGITTPFHYVPLHQSPMGESFHDGRPLPMSEALGSRLVRLPLFYNLTDGDQAIVIDRVQEFLRGC